MLFKLQGKARNSFEIEQTKHSGSFLHCMGDDSCIFDLILKCQTTGGGRAKQAVRCERCRGTGRGTWRRCGEVMSSDHDYDAFVCILSAREHQLGLHVYSSEPNQVAI